MSGIPVLPADKEFKSMQSLSFNPGWKEPVPLNLYENPAQEKPE